MLDDRELYRRVRAGLAAEIALFGSASEGARLVRRPGVLASRVPRAPHRSLFNSILADTKEALASAYDELADAYEAAFVLAFTVWLDPQDEPSATFLAARGHVLDGQPHAMAAELRALTLPDPGELAWEETRDLALIGRINDAAYGVAVPGFEAALRRLPPALGRAYVARQGAEAVCCLVSLDTEAGDCAITAVATLPHARGRGLATQLLARALEAAEARGCAVATLQATSQGMPLYRKLGFRALGRMSMWERRKAAGG